MLKHIKAVDLVWEKKQNYRREVWESTLSLFGTFTIYCISPIRYEVYFKGDIIPTVTKSLEKAKQICQDYVQEIAEEIVKC